MREDFLHFIWKYKKLQLEDLFTSNNETVFIRDVGTHNHLSGSDFFNAKIEINGQLWAGNVEIHIKTSDWFTHNHENDPKYSNVIMHVVWENDASVFGMDNKEIPTLELKNIISKNILKSYQQLFDKREVSFINCEKDIKDINPFLFDKWLERIYVERLERKSELVLELLEQSKNDWEKVLFALLLKNFGLKINGDSFLSIAQALDFETVRKIQNNTFQLESVLFGMAGFLADDTIIDNYYRALVKEYHYLMNKYGLQNESCQKPEFFKLRPPNFPTIRLSQLANLYSMHKNLFSKVIEATSVEEFYILFEIAASKYWDNHFSFGKISKKGTKKLTIKFIDLLIINTILPLKFCYARYSGDVINEEIVSMIGSITIENNSVTENFKSHGVQMSNAMDSQAILQLYNEYCTKNKCLECAVGSRLLNRNG